MWIYFILGLLFAITIEICVKRFIVQRDITIKLPCVWGLPFIGIAYKLVPTYKTLYVFDSCFKKLKCSTFYTYIANTAVLVTIDPEIIKRMVTSDEFINKASMLYSPIDNAIPNGVLTSKELKWKHNRKLINASFSHNILTKLMPTMDKGAKLLIEEFNMLENQGEKPLLKIIKQTVVKIALETTFGVPFDESNEDLLNGIYYLLDEVRKDVLCTPLNLNFLIRNSKYYKTVRRIRECIFKISQRRLKMNNMNFIDNDVCNIKKDTKIFIDQAHEFHNKGLFDTNDVINEAFTLISASFETITLCTHSVLVMLAMHSDVQEKLFQEIYEFCPEKTVHIEYMDFKRLPYLDMVINETLRLIPPLPLIGRQTEVNCRLTDNITLPRNMQVFIPLFSLHRRKDIWGSSADVFNPDNFLPHNTNRRHPYAYMPFSKGHRNCIGWQYAYIFNRILLINLLRNFKFSTGFKYEDLIFRDDIFLQYHKEPQISIAKRYV